MNMLTNFTAEDQGDPTVRRRWRRTTLAALPVVLIGGAWLAFHRDAHRLAPQIRHRLRVHFRCN